MRVNIKSQKGITLMLLVITIIVILLIAGASATMVLDEQGLLQSSKKSKDAQESYANEQEARTNELIDSVGSDKDYIDQNGANVPKLKLGMVPVKWNETQNAWIVTDKADSQWYSYADQKWANIMLTDGLVVEGISDASTATIAQMKGKKVTSIGSMFVWVPRFAYKITNNYHQGGDNIKGEVSIAFLKGNTNTPSKSGITIVEYNSSTTDNYTKFPDGYVVHPAFNYEEEISGLWVAKFEASHTNCTTSESTGSDGTNLSTLEMQVKPKVTSWRNINIGNCYTACMNYKPNYSSHLMKNTEWGAVSYLAKSIYGNSQMYMNNSGSYLTGASGNGESVSTNVSTDITYTSTQAVKASTTGNVTGIYDMAGGAWEFVAGYIDNSFVQKEEEGSETANNRFDFGGNLLLGANKSKNVYLKGDTDSDSGNFEANKASYGDALYEVARK